MKKIVKNFNNLVKNIIFKIQNKRNNKLIISNLNKFLITFIGALFLYMFYLLIPILYDKNWVKDNIQNKLADEFKLNVKLIDNFSYRILPAPHFLIKDSKLLSSSSKNKRSIGEIKDLKIFLSQMNFFDKKKLKIKKVVVDNADFYLLRHNIDILNNSVIRKFSNKKIQVKNGNIFFKDNLDEIVTIIKINKADLFFDDKKLQNHLDLEGNIFGIPFVFELQSKIDSIIKKNFSFKAKTLNLHIFNNSIIKKDNPTLGSNIISFLKSSINTEYELIDGNIVFTSKNSKINNLKINYDGELSINPFDLDLHINLGNSKIYKIFSINPLLIEFFKSGLMFNDNVNLNTSIDINSKKREDFFDDAKIYFNILNGKINLDKTKFINNDIGSLQLDNSSLFLQNNELILNTNLFFHIKNPDVLFSFLNTSKKSRKEIKNILININYDFSNNEIKFNNIKIDNNEVSVNFFNIIEGFMDNNLNNLIRTRRLINELLTAYEG